MSEMEKKELKDRIKALTDEETNEVIRLMPSDLLWDELIRRNTKMLQRINKIEDTLGITVDNIHPISIKAWEDIRERYTDVEDKFIYIKKGFGA